MAWGKIDLVDAEGPWAGTVWLSRAPEMAFEALAVLTIALRLLAAVLRSEEVRFRSRPRGRQLMGNADHERSRLGSPSALPSPRPGFRSRDDQVCFFFLVRSSLTHRMVGTEPPASNPPDSPALPTKSTPSPPALSLSPLARTCLSWSSREERRRARWALGRRLGRR